MDSGMVIGVVALIVICFVLVLIKQAFLKGVYKGVDAAEKAIRQKRETKSGPEQTRLSDVYEKEKSKK